MRCATRGFETSSTHPAPAYNSPVPVVLGSDRLLGSMHLDRVGVGLVCNPTSVDASFLHIADRVAACPNVTLAALFGPQHGFRSDVQDNMIETGHAQDPTLRVPVYSLYSETREPTAEMLRDIDVLVVDLQDVGTRVYTYISTMANCLRACRAHSVPVIVCDRPNPIGGEAVEGPVLDSAFASFVGQFPIPMRHGMTLGELAQLFNEHFSIGSSARGREDGRMATVDVPGHDRPAVGSPITQPSDARQRDRLSGHRAPGRDEHLRGPRYHHAI